MSSRANQFIADTPEPPAWLTRVCQSPMGKSLFLYILKDPTLRDHLRTGDYNALIDFFTSTLILNSTDLCSTIHEVDLNCCCYATTVLFFDRILNDIAHSTSYAECESKITQFLDSYSFASVQECNVFINYIATLLAALPSPPIQAFLQQLLERVFDTLRTRHSITLVETPAPYSIDHSALLRGHSAIQRSPTGHSERSHRRLHASGRAKLAFASTLSRRPSGVPPKPAFSLALFLLDLAISEHSVLWKQVHGDGRADSAVAAAGEACGEGAGAAAADVADVHVARRGAISRCGAARIDDETVRKRERGTDGDRVVLSGVLHAVAGDGESGKKGRL